MAQQTKCWECAKACGGCSWADHFIPVDGWCAIKTRLKLHNTSGLMDDCASYIVIDCPQFKKDALPGGLDRIK